MSDTVIRVQGLGKQYRIGPRERYRTFRDTLAGMFRSNGKSKGEKIWALKDVSFEIEKGEIVGIIGRNGAGKSTLLKILSRITEPSEGEVELRGRVGSLLEVGTGFHPELTGRENIFLNGAILGMKKAEIARKFDEIVAFAEVEKFVDTPVKHFSSGMYTRLAFSVAAHLEPEILMIDEVLSVGDAAFQKKCLGKMGNDAKEGRTVLIVSHQMNQIRRLCTRCLWLESGRMEKWGGTVDVVSSYELSFTTNPVGDSRNSTGSNIKGRFLSWKLVGNTSKASHSLSQNGPVHVSFAFSVGQEIKSGHHGIALYNSEGHLIWGTAFSGLRLNPGITNLVHVLPSLPVRPGIYNWRVSMYDSGEPLDVWSCHPQMIVGTMPVNHPLDMWQGVLNLPSDLTLS